MEFLESTSPAEQEVEREIRVMAENAFQRLSGAEAEASQPEIPVDYDEEDPNLPGSPVEDHQTAGASPAEDLMVAENQAQYEAFRDPVCNACFSSYAAGMVTCPTCDAVQSIQLTASEQRLAITDAVQSSRAEFTLQWTEDTSYRGTRVAGSRADLYKHGIRYLRAKKASVDYMGSPNDGNDPWPSCIARFEADQSFKRGMLLKHSTEQEARTYLAQVDEAVQQGPGEGTDHWSIENRRNFLGDEQRYRLNLVDTAGRTVSSGTDTPARHTLSTYAAMTKGKAGPGKGKGRSKTSAVKGKDKRSSAKTSKDNRPTDAPPGDWDQQPTQQTAAASSSSSASTAPARAAQTATPVAVVEAPPARFVNEATLPAQETAPARAARDYSGSDIRRLDRPPPAQTAPASQPYYHASSGPNRAKASAPPDHWYGSNTDDQTAEQSLWHGHQGWDTWTQREWQNGYQ